MISQKIVQQELGRKGDVRFALPSYKELQSDFFREYEEFYNKFSKVKGTLLKMVWMAHRDGNKLLEKEAQKNFDYFNKFKTLDTRRFVETLDKYIK